MLLVFSCALWNFKLKTKEYECVMEFPVIYFNVLMWGLLGYVPVFKPHTIRKQITDNFQSKLNRYNLHILTSISSKKYAWIKKMLWNMENDKDFLCSEQYWYPLCTTKCAILLRFSPCNFRCKTRSLLWTQFTSPIAKSQIWRMCVWLFNVKSRRGNKMTTKSTQ